MLALEQKVGGADNVANVDADGQADGDEAVLPD